MHQTPRSFRLVLYSPHNQHDYHDKLTDHVQVFKFTIFPGGRAKDEAKKRLFNYPSHFEWATKLVSEPKPLLDCGWEIWQGGQKTVFLTADFFGCSSRWSGATGYQTTWQEILYSWFPLPTIIMIIQSHLAMLNPWDRKTVLISRSKPILESENANWCR